MTSMNIEPTIETKDIFEGNLHEVEPYQSKQPLLEDDKMNLLNEVKNIIAKKSLLNLVIC